MIHFRQFVRSISHALHGIGVAIKTEQSFRIQLIAAVCAFGLGFFFRVSRNEWILLLLLIGAVLALELLNSVLERMVDTFKPRLHPMVGEMKDLMAATVFVISLIAFIVGVLIFFPYIFQKTLLY